MSGEDKYALAGRIAAEVMEAAVRKVREGARLLDVAVFAEQLIVEKGAEPAFPINISINDRAAHYTPDAWDEGVFRRGDLVKVDIGVHVDGHIGDIACSKAVGGGHRELMKASRAALERAIELIKPGVLTNEIGGAIESVIAEHGFKPVSNLTGHMLSPWSLHSGLLIPNVRTRHGFRLKEGDVVAIEPFATTGVGRVVDEPTVLIFRFLGARGVRMREARLILSHVRERYQELPFAERWIAHLVPRYKLGLALRQLVQAGALHAYHVLREKEGGLVSQAEHSLRVTGGGCEVLTEV